MLATGGRESVGSALFISSLSLFHLKDYHVYVEQGVLVCSKSLRYNTNLSQCCIKLSRSSQCDGLSSASHPHLMSKWH